MNPCPSLRQIAKRQDANVVILPTAAPRQVQQNYNRGASAARASLRAESPFAKGHFKSHQEREARRMAEELAKVERTPTLFLMLAMLEGMSDDQRKAMVAALAPLAVSNDAAMQAVHVIRSTMLTIGQRLDLQRAQAELRGGDA